MCLKCVFLCFLCFHVFAKETHVPAAVSGSSSSIGGDFLDLLKDGCCP